MPVKLLFVCLGNICRSPAAENIMNYLIQQAGLTYEVSCDSAGTSDYHIGASPDQRMVAAAAQRGLSMHGIARQFAIEDFEEFDLILAMDQDNAAAIRYLDPKGTYHHKVRLICEFCTRYTLTEVPDPYYGGSEGFNLVLDLLMDACQGVLNDVTQAPTAPSCN